MFRRRFLQLAALSGTGALASLDAMAASAAHSTTYLVEGFSCPTCAVGLDTMLGRQKGVVSSKSTYPEGKVTVCHHPDQITDDRIRAFISEIGFTVKTSQPA